MNAHSHPLTSLSLLERARAHDDEAWEQLVALYYPLVYQWCRDNGLQEQDVLDVVQEVFRAVASSLHTFHRDQEGHSFRKWLRGVTRHKMGDFWRKKPTEHVELAAILADGKHVASAESSEHTDRLEIGGVAHRALALIRQEFEERTWEAASQVLVMCEPVAKVAQSLGMTTNAVYKAKSRVIRRIREQFTDLLENE